VSEQNPSPEQEGAPPDAPLDFAQLLDAIQARIVKGRFPPKKLANRLINLGVREFIDKEPPIHTYGFPFKFVTHLDEAILAMAHYLHRFRRAGGELKVYAINRLPKGEDKTLAYWQSEKARLYLELQNIILLLGGFAGMKSEVSRIFAFRRMDDFAFLTQSAISAINEQAAIGIRVGLLFHESFRKSTPWPGDISDTLLIDFQPAPARRPDGVHNFYQLRDMLEDANPFDLPYHGRCTARWFETRAAAEAATEDVAPLVGLFEAAWEKVGKDPRGVAVYSDPWSNARDGRDEGGAGSEGHFKRAAVAMYRAFANSERFTKLGADRGLPARGIVDRINRSVVTADMIRLERAISTFEKSSAIHAVDTTSVKATIKIHEAEPLYRRWLRTSLNGVLKEGSRKSLNRVYVLNDKSELAADEFRAFKRIMHYYCDYCHYNLSAMAPVVNAHDEPDPAKAPSWLPAARRTLKGRVNIFVTTVSALEDFTQRRLVPKSKDKGTPEHKEGSDVFTIFSRRLPQMLQDALGIKDDSKILLADAHDALKKLDFLYTDGMIYNFLTDRADLSEQTFEAYLYRDSFDVTKERDILFEVPGAWKDPQLADFKRYQMPYLLTEYASSVLDYLEQYGESLLSAEKEDYGELIANLRAWLGRPEARPSPAADDAPDAGEGAANDDAPPATAGVRADDLLEVRRAIEDALYAYFRPIFSYFYKLLEFLSVKVDLFGGDSLDKVFPFVKYQPEGEGAEKPNDDDALESLNDTIREAVAARLAGGSAALPMPPRVTRPSGAKGGTDEPTPVIFLSHASEDRAKVVKIARRLKAAGYDAWLDRDKLPVGGNWRDRIEEAIRTSHIFMSCLSKKSVVKNGPVQRELRLALDAEKNVPLGGIFILPVRLDDCKPPRALSMLTSVKLFVGDGWNEQGWSSLLWSIETALEERGLKKVQRPARARASKGSP